MSPYFISLQTVIFEPLNLKLAKNKNKNKRQKLHLKHKRKQNAITIQLGKHKIPNGQEVERANHISFDEDPTEANFINEVENP